MCSLSLSGLRPSGKFSRRVVVIMYEKCPASLKMKRVILQNGYFDESVYHCEIITYNPEEESIYLLTGKYELPLFSLDGVYECVLEAEEELRCEGVIRERYLNKLGNVVVFYVRNGFYKNLVN